MVNKEQEQDKKNRVLILECMASCARLGLTEHVKDLGQSSAKLAQTIKTKDYSKDQPFDWEKKVNEGCDRQGIPHIYPKLINTPAPHPLPEVVR